MDFRGLSRHEQQRLDEIERRLGAEDPDMVSAFRVAPAAAGPDDRTVYLLLGVLLACVGLFADMPLLVLLSMTGATVALLIPKQTTAERHDDAGHGPSVPLA